MQSIKLIRLSETERERERKRNRERERNGLGFQLLFTNRSSHHRDNQVKFCQVLTRIQIQKCVKQKGKFLISCLQMKFYQISPKCSIATDNRSCSRGGKLKITATSRVLQITVDGSIFRSFLWERCSCCRRDDSVKRTLPNLLSQGKIELGSLLASV